MINESCAINADELIEGAKRRYIEEYKERITKGILLAIRQGELIRFTTEGNMRGEIIIEGRLTVKTNQ